MTESQKIELSEMVGIGAGLDGAGYFKMLFTTGDGITEVRVSLEELITVHIWAGRAIHEKAMPGYQQKRDRKFRESLERCGPDGVARARDLFGPVD